nr:uncharacterized protein CI109_003721 [Kwoniella shandongensis]KAA5528066.1 hypothetical protein CI109_003721 [Kwoniella shandongensis]
MSYPEHSAYTVPTSGPEYDPTLYDPTTGQPFNQWGDAGHGISWDSSGHTIIHNPPPGAHHPKLDGAALSNTVGGAPTYETLVPQPNNQMGPDAASFNSPGFSAVHNPQERQSYYPLGSGTTMNDHKSGQSSSQMSRRQPLSNASGQHRHTNATFKAGTQKLTEDRVAKPATTTRTMKKEWKRKHVTAVEFGDHMQGPQERQTYYPTGGGISSIASGGFTMGDHTSGQCNSQVSSEQPSSKSAGQNSQTIVSTEIGIPKERKAGEQKPKKQVTAEQWGAHMQGKVSYMRQRDVGYHLDQYRERTLKAAVATYYFKSDPRPLKYLKDHKISDIQIERLHDALKTEKERFDKQEVTDEAAGKTGFRFDKTDHTSSSQYVQPYVSPGSAQQSAQYQFQLAPGNPYQGYQTPYIRNTVEPYADYSSNVQPFTNPEADLFNQIGNPQRNVAAQSGYYHESQSFQQPNSTFGTPNVFSPSLDLALDNQFYNPTPSILGSNFDQQGYHTDTNVPHTHEDDAIDPFNLFDNNPAYQWQ